MSSPSILNDVLGPVMRGPSSSHTAGSYHIARTVRDLLGGEPARAEFVFDPSGSYARTFREQGVDLALAAGLMGWPIADPRFSRALDAARAKDLRIVFRVARIEGADHPNTVVLNLASQTGETLAAIAKSTGGGGFVVSSLDGWPAAIDGKAYLVLVRSTRSSRAALRAALRTDAPLLGDPSWQTREREVLMTLRLERRPGDGLLKRLAAVRGLGEIRTAAPVFFVPKGAPLFDSAESMLRAAARRRSSLGQTALAYEARLLGLSEESVAEEIVRRFAIMKDSVAGGFDDRSLRMQLLRPSARRVMEAEHAGRLAIGGLHVRAAARALAAMHVSNSMGVVVAAPTGGSAGVIPGVIVTLAEECRLQPDMIARCLAAASAIGLILAKRATFAAEVAGCQVEIGAAGAMAAAAVIEAAGGTPRQAVDAAAISFQNSMGSVCDLVQGMCEIPCHTRNAVAASSAFVCADLVMGGYANPIPLDETIDAVFDCGKMLPPELRCTARGGLALAPSARRLPNLRSRPR